MSKHPDFDSFVETIAALRAPDGCPWDREQTHQSIAKNMIEEAYEAVDAIEAEDIPHMREELGDVLLQVVLQSQIAQEAKEFTIDDVCRDVNDKIIRRHPHVFGEQAGGELGANEVLEIWDQVKLTEHNNVGEEQPEQVKGLMDAVPRSFPALMQAQKISRKAVSAGFEWETLDDVWAQVYSEIDELKTAYDQAPKDAKGKVTEATEVELEMGDVLFSLVNVARKMGVDAEASLRASCAKFRNRWEYMESAAAKQNRAIDELSVDEMEELWAEAKQREASDTSK